MRPCVLIEQINGACKILLISAALDLYDPINHFLLNADHPDFRHTGLKRTSYIDAEVIITAKLSDLDKFIGKIHGHLAQELKDWLGL